MRFIAVGVTMAILLSVVGCTGSASRQPAQFDQAQGTPTDKVRWSIQFADANGTNTGAASQDPSGQVRVIEALGQGGCRVLDARALSMNGIDNVRATIDGLAVEGKLGQHDAIVFTAIAVTAYCPKYKPDFEALMTANRIVLKPTSWTPADNEFGGPTSSETPKLSK
jgi:hypothetical protein